MSHNHGTTETSIEALIEEQRRSRISQNFSLNVWLALSSWPGCSNRGSPYCQTKQWGS